MNKTRTIVLALDFPDNTSVKNMLPMIETALERLKEMRRDDLITCVNFQGKDINDMINFGINPKVKKVIDDVIATIGTEENQIPNKWSTFPGYPWIMACNNLVIDPSSPFVDSTKKILREHFGQNEANYCIQRGIPSFVHIVNQLRNPYSNYGHPY